jgi:hypothetical protein
MKLDMARMEVGRVPLGSLSDDIENKGRVGGGSARKTRGAKSLLGELGMDRAGGGEGISGGAGEGGGGEGGECKQS